MRPSDATADALAAVPALPRDHEGPVFAEPWQAEAFAMALTLHERGLFTWTEWAERLAAAIRRARSTGDPDLGDTYYHHWLSALEALVVEKGALGVHELSVRRDAWDRAARATPHGEPIELGMELRSQTPR